MSPVLDFEGPIYRASFDLAPTIPLHVHLVKGAEYAVWIDTGVKPMFPALAATMAQAGLQDGDLQFVLNTHSHHDHIGCNAQVKDKTGCLIAAHPHYAAWHEDFEQHYQEFARPFPHLVADTPALRDEVLSPLDAPRPIDVFIDEGVTFQLGGGVSLRAISLPGHMLAELGWLEASTRTLILGDAVTGLDWPLFHSHLSVRGYRDSLTRIRALIEGGSVEQVLFAHFAPLPAADVEDLLQRAGRYIDAVEVTMLRLLAESETVSLESLWAETCRRMRRVQEFRALNMVYAHVLDLVERKIVEEVERERYQLR